MLGDCLLLLEANKSDIKAMTVAESQYANAVSIKDSAKNNLSLEWYLYYVATTY